MLLLAYDIEKLVVHFIIVFNFTCVMHFTCFSSKWAVFLPIRLFFSFREKYRQSINLTVIIVIKEIQQGLASEEDDNICHSLQQAIQSSQTQNTRLCNKHSWFLIVTLISMQVFILWLILSVMETILHKNLLLLSFLNWDLEGYV